MLVVNINQAEWRKSWRGQLSAFDSRCLLMICNLAEQCNDLKSLFQQSLLKDLLRNLRNDFVQLQLLVGRQDHISKM